ncbi:flagellar protein FlaG [Pseudomonas abietaniphila]|uniref:Flagellar protein FlaG n=1 Tax=Pseudomonas abietaniphila TaxID=89065 RepID=A0A1G8S6C8_9PSED|nr:flagellar protein FlaG [Pseudomonas abietaniphila]SDJ24788.1 flagellar protein FlaG [Pseudomonas abietaniphila]
MDMSVKLNLSYPSVLPSLDARPPVDTVPSVSAPSSVPDAVQSQPKREEMENAIADIRKFVQNLQRKLDFSIDDSTGQTVVKVIASDTGDVIRQIPSETALKLAQSLTQASSLFFDAKV